MLRALEEIGVDYAVVGSLASGAHGEARATTDVDILARLTAPMLAQLAARLGEDFYLDLGEAEEALRLGRSFPVVSRTEVLKFDFLPAGGDAFGAAQLARKEMVGVPFLAGAGLPVVSAEDVVLAKLRGCGSSEQQWRDILGVLAVQGEDLDWAYIEEWAPRLGVADLLGRLPRCGA
jgi:hypothetical protein